MYHLVRGLQRGLDVLAALNRVGEASAARLAEETALPRPTVHRLLETPRALGYVDRSHKRDAYRLASKVTTLSSGYRWSDRLTEVAEPILAELGEEVRWPVDVLAYEDGAMVVRVTTHRESALSLTRVTPGTRMPVLATASGHAYLAFCPASERNAILRILAADPASAPYQAAQLATRLEDARARGYATRRRTATQKTSSIAVPILAKRRVLGCISVIWFDSALAPQAAAQQMFPHLAAAAKKVATEYLSASR